MRSIPIRRRALAAALALGTAAAGLTAAAPAQAATSPDPYSAFAFALGSSEPVIYSFINSATTTLDMTMYELTDTTAINDLIAREKAGVAVRVILDNANQTTNQTAYTDLSDAGVGVVWSSTAFTYTHQKTITINDDESLILTGNLTSNYYSTSRDYGVFDADPNDVAAIEATFAADYAHTSITPSDGDNLLWSPTTAQTQLLSVINGATKTLDVQEEEFSDTAIVDAIVADAERGVTVRMVLENESSDYASEISQVTAAGGKVVTYTSSTGFYIHAKAIVADYGLSTAKVEVGSMNMTSNSLGDNRELGIILTDPGVENVVESTFNDDFNGTNANTVSVTAPANQTGAVGTAASLQISASDSASGQTLTYSADNLPTGLSINASTGLISGTPSAAGSYTTVVTATDTTGQAAQAAFNWTVSGAAGGNAVTVTAPGSQTATVGTAASLQISASDSASGQTLTYSAAGLPAGLSINASTGLISGTPTTAGSDLVTVTATDTTGASGSASFTWTVNPKPDFSLSVAPTAGSVTAGSSTSTTVSTAAIGGFSGTVAFTDSGLPTGATATFSPTSAAVGSSSTLTLATSSSTAAGTYSITVTGTSGSLTHTAAFSLTVNAAGADTITVTNPGNQTGTVGTAASLQISATDSASGKTLTYAATGLPAGLSISSSGLITGTPTTAGTSSVTISVTDGTGASGSASFTWTVSAASSGCTAAQLLGNPGFENGSSDPAPWVVTSTHTPLSVINDSSKEPPHSGTWDAWLDGWGTTTTDTVAQTVTIPATCDTASFSFWLHIDTAETTTTTAYDTLNVQVLNSAGTVLGTVATFSNLNAASGYTQHTYSLASYIGQTVTLKFTGAEDYEKQTSFVIDDTALNVD